MKHKIFKKEQKVKVIADGRNASDFTLKLNTSPIGLYAIPNWEDKIFTIEGKVELINFKHDPTVFCAYLLTCKGRKVGYVYNTGLKKLK